VSHVGRVRDAEGLSRLFFPSCSDLSVLTRAAPATAGVARVAEAAGGPRHGDSVRALSLAERTSHRAGWGARAPAACAAAAARARQRGGGGLRPRAGARRRGSREAGRGRRGRAVGGARARASRGGARARDCGAGRAAGWSRPGPKPLVLVWFVFASFGLVCFCWFCNFFAATPAAFASASGARWQRGAAAPARRPLCPVGQPQRGRRRLAGRGGGVLSQGAAAGRNVPCEALHDIGPRLPGVPPPPRPAPRARERAPLCSGGRRPGVVWGVVTSWSYVTCESRTCSAHVAVLCPITKRCGLGV